MKLLNPKKQDIGLYDSDTGKSLKVTHAVDLSDETPNRSKLKLLYTKAVKARSFSSIPEDRLSITSLGHCPPWIWRTKPCQTSPIGQE